MTKKLDYDPPSKAIAAIHDLMKHVEGKVGKDDYAHEKGGWRTKSAVYHVDRAIDHLWKWKKGDAKDEDGFSPLVNALTRVAMGAELAMGKREQPRRAVVYLASPYKCGNTVNDDFVIFQHWVAAHMRAWDLWKLGFTCISPISNTAFMNHQDIDHQRFLDGDLDILARCDALLMNRGWENSDGCRAEKVFAEGHDIPVFTNTNALVAWGKDREV